MPKRKTGCGFNRNKHVETPKNLTFKAIGSLDNMYHYKLYLQNMIWDK